MLLETLPDSESTPLPQTKTSVFLYGKPPTPPPKPPTLVASGFNNWNRGGDLALLESTYRHELIPQELADRFRDEIGPLFSGDGEI